MASQEKFLQMKKKMIRRGYFFNDDDFRELIMSEYIRKYKDSEDIIPFNASDGYIVNFKNRHKISSKKCHVKRRPEKSLFVDNFLKTVEDPKENEDNDYIINIDETCWEVFPKNILVWQEKGKDTVSTYFNKANSKACLTAIAGISASGTKLPIMFIGKEKTDFVENSQIGDVGPHLKDHSESGWVTEEVFLNYLVKMCDHFGSPDGPKLHLILDFYPSHRTDAVKNFAVGLKINLIYVPAGLTDQYQTLDSMYLDV